MEGGGGNEWKVVKIILLIRFWQIYSEKLPERSMQSFKISEFETAGLILNLQVLICEFLPYDKKNLIKSVS